MISNFFLKDRIEKAKNKRDDLTKKKLELSLEIRDLGISNQAAWKYRNGKMSSLTNACINSFDKEKFDKRDNLSKEIASIEKKIIECNNEISALSREEDAEKNKKLMEVFSEIFTHRQMKEIKQEAVRRMNGESGFKMSFSVRDAIENKEQKDIYKKIAKEQLDRMIEFRIMLTQVIDNGMKQYGNDFLKVISPLNRLIIPVDELKKIKIKHLIN